MTSPVCGAYDMTETNLFMKQEQTRRHREQSCDCGGRERGRMGRLGLAEKLSHREWVEQHGPPAERRAQRSASCDNPQWGGYERVRAQQRRFAAEQKLATL